MSAITKYEFTVHGPVALMGAWRTADCTEYLWGAFTPEPLTKAEIEALIDVFDECSPVTWHGMSGEYEAPTNPNGDVTGLYRIVLTELTS